MKLEEVARRLRQEWRGTSEGRGGRVNRLHSNLQSHGIEGMRLAAAIKMGGVIEGVTPDGQVLRSEKQWHDWLTAHWLVANETPALVKVRAIPQAETIAVWT